MRRTLRTLNAISALPNWLIPSALLALFTYQGVDSVVHHDASGALLMGIAIGLMAAALLLTASRRSS